MAHTRYGEPKPASFTGEPGLYVLSSFFSNIGRSRALFAISGSRWMTHWLLPSKWRSELPGQSGLVLPDLQRPLGANTRHRDLPRESRCCLITGLALNN